MRSPGRVLRSPAFLVHKLESFPLPLMLPNPASFFITSFQGNGSITLNGTNNPNVPYSDGATPFSSSLVPLPLQNSQIEGSPSSSNPSFSDISNLLCLSGADGPGDTWLATDSHTAVITVRTFASVSASGIRLGNTFLSGYGTTGFR